MLEYESEVDDEEPEGATAPGDSLAPPGVQCVGCVGIDVGKNVDGLVSQRVSNNPGLDVIALEEQRVAGHDLAHDVGLADMEGAAEQPRHDSACAHRDHVLVALHLDDEGPLLLRHDGD